MTAVEEIPQLMEWYGKGKTQEDAKIDEWLIRTVREVESLLRIWSPSKPLTFESSEDWKSLLKSVNGGTRPGSITQQSGAKILVNDHWPQRLIAAINILQARLKR
jgi:hypothetical protein